MTAEIVSPRSTSLRISGPYWSAYLANNGSWKAAASDSRTVWPAAWIPSNDRGSFTSVSVAPARVKASAVAWTWAATSREARRRSSGASARRGGLPGSTATRWRASTENTSPASATPRVKTPTWSSDPASGITPVVDTRPCVGLKPTTPQ